MKLTLFFRLQMKRVCKNVPFVLLLLLFPFAMFLLSHSFTNEADSRIAVGICLDTEDALAETVCKKLLTLDDSLFVFLPVDTEESLVKQVQNNTLECGYLFKKELGTELDKSHLKNLITVYVSETTTCTGVLNELVYANLFEEYSLSLLQESLMDAEHLPFHEADTGESDLPLVTAQDIEESYRSHLENGSTFRFDVHFVSGTESSTLTGTTAAAIPLLRGLAALFLLLCGFLGQLIAYHDEQNGLYTKLYGKKRFLFPRVTQLTYLLPAGLVCLLSLSLSGSFTTLGKELSALICYMFALSVFYTILGSLIRNHTILCAALPMILLCTLVFTPIIVDFSSYFPWMRVVRYILPTYYYLLFF